jgi:hypothetical protein
MKLTRAFCCALAVITVTAALPARAQDQLLTPKVSPPPAAREPGGFPRLSPPAQELAERLNVLETMRSLHAKQEEFQRSSDNLSLLQTVVLRQKLLASMQHAAVEVEEAVAAIDGDLAFANMLLAYASSRRDRSVMLNNIATFVGSGAFGILDSSTDISVGIPAPQVLGIIGNSIATGLPLVGLRRRAYQNPRRRQGQPNMLAPIFGRPFKAESYDPLVWSYIESAAAPGSDQTRRQQLLQRWRTLRGLGTTGSASQDYIDAIVGMPGKDDKITVEMLKTRAELLYDLRSVVQLMYRDISELNTATLAL